MKHEEYKCLCVSTRHITKEDENILNQKAKDNNTMIAERETGYFVKLFEHADDNVYSQLSEAFNSVLEYAHVHGYRMVEFDCDAQEYEVFQKFDW